jgi:hypothetical protein
MPKNLTTTSLIPKSAIGPDNIPKKAEMSAHKAIPTKTNPFVERKRNFKRFIISCIQSPAAKRVQEFICAILHSVTKLTSNVFNQS